MQPTTLARAFYFFAVVFAVTADVKAHIDKPRENDVGAEVVTAAANGQHIMELKSKESAHKAASSKALKDIGLAEGALYDSNNVALIQTTETFDAKEYWSDKAGTTTGLDDTVCQKWTSRVTKADCEGGEGKGMVFNYFIPDDRCRTLLSDTEFSRSVLVMRT